MNRSLFAKLCLLAIALTTTACELAASDLKRRRNRSGADDDAELNKGAEDGPKCTEYGASYVGFGNTKLEVNRVNAAIGADRARVKPYSALRAEYDRALGVVPKGLEGEAASFGASPERFTIEPQANAIQLYSAFRIAFNGCLSYTAKVADMTKAPTAESAAKQCTAMARKFWHRAPTPAEAEACTNVAMVDAAQEADPARRWAYTCASLLSSAGFLTY